MSTNLRRPAGRSRPSASLGITGSGDGDTPGLPWLIYCRVSTEEQANEGASLAAQEAACRGYCTQRRLRIAEVITDPGFSGKNLERPGVARALDLLRSGQAAGVVVWRIDRLTRNLRDLLFLIDLTETHAVALASVTEHIATDHPMGRLMLHMMGSMAQWERETIAERARAGMQQRISQGAWVGGPVPAGCQVVVGPDGLRRLAEHPEEGPIVRDIWPRVAQGATLMDIARYLTAAKVTPPRKLGWRKQTVHSLMRQERLIGILTDEATFQAAAARLNTRFRKVDVHRVSTASRIYPLQHLARCATCGAPMCGVPMLSKGKSYAYYRCTAKPKGLCRAKDLPGEAWERAAMEGLRVLVERGGPLEARLQADAAAADGQGRTLAAERDAILAQRAEVEARINKLLDLVEQGQAPGASVRSRLAAMQAEADALERRADAMAGQIAASAMERHGVGMMLDELTRHLDALPADLEVQRRALHTFCRSIRMGVHDGVPVLEFAVFLPALWGVCQRLPASDAVSSLAGLVVGLEGFETLNRIVPARLPLVDGPHRRLAADADLAGEQRRQLILPALVKALVLGHGEGFPQQIHHA